VLLHAHLSFVSTVTFISVIHYNFVPPFSVRMKPVSCGSNLGINCKITMPFELIWKEVFILTPAIYTGKIEESKKSWTPWTFYW
jgi:hypothetical protein